MTAEPATKKINPLSSSKNLLADNVDALRRLFPEAFVENSDDEHLPWKIDLEVLRELVGDFADERTEKYSFGWHGKSRARWYSQVPSTGTLLPATNESESWDSTANLFIEGDNLEVLKLLQKSYHGKVKLIYIDPPYNTGGEFIYPDRFQDNLETYLRYTDQKEGEFRASNNAEYSGRFHTNWLNMMYPRLKLARNLLSHDGAIFISIDDHECHNLKQVCNELFGEENFKADIAWQKRYTRSNNTIDFTTVVEHILVYAKSEAFEVNLLPRSEEADARYTNPDDDPRGPWKGASFLNPATPAQRPNLCYEIENPNTGQKTSPTTNAWRRSKEEFAKLAADNRLYWGGDGKSPVPSIKMFLSDARGLTPTNFWPHDYAGNTDDGTADLRALFDNKVFDNPKPVQLLKRVIEHTCDSDSIILDFFAGSCTVGQATIEKNIEDGGKRRFIAIQLPEPSGESTNAYKAGFKTIAEIAKERLRRVKKKLEGDKSLFDSSVDAGFRAFKLSSSNIHAWDSRSSEIEDQLLASVSSVKSDRSELDVLYEVILKSGLDLAVPVETYQEGDMSCYVIGFGSLLVCFDEEIAEKNIDFLLALHSKFAAADARIVLMDNAFKSDVEKTNSLQRLAQAGLTDVNTI